MAELSNNFLSFSIYNLSRYIFLKIESEYEIYLEKYSVTLPQIRTMWIIKCFPNISALSISKIGCWSPPTVTNMLKLIEEKQYISKKHKLNKKEFSINLTPKGEELIQNTKLNSSSNLSLIKLINIFKNEDLDFMINFLKNIVLNNEDNLLIDYIENLNKNSLKFELNSFEKSNHEKIKKATYFYNLLRVFVLNIEKEHSILIKNLNITYPQLRALKIIKSFPGINSYDLSKLAFWSHSTANLIANNLYNKGFIKKEKSNIKNSINLSITNAGKDIILYDINNNISKISYMQKLIESKHNDLFYANTILSDISKHLGIEVIKEVIYKTYLINPLH